jgi:tetratricopeptide (TPR) repeat protein
MPDLVDDAERTFQVVYIPSDLSEPLAEQTVRQAKGDALGAMFAHAKAHFASRTLSRGQADSFKSKVRSEQKAAISSEVLNRLADMTLCEVVPLCPNSAAFGHVGVNLAADDKAVAKDLPANVRASAIARQCGLSLQVRGDAFVYRQFDNDEGFKRLDFGLRDVASDAPWMTRARELRVGAKPKPDPEGDKAKGNAYFSKKQWALALEQYARGLSQPIPDADLRSALHSNSSACLLHLNRAEEALTSARECVNINPSWFKGHARLGDAYLALGKKDAALSCYRTAQSLAPGNAEMQSRLRAMNEDDSGV